jgi:hypothetical protein
MRDTRIARLILEFCLLTFATGCVATREGGDPARPIVTGGNGLAPDQTLYVLQPEFGFFIGDSPSSYVLEYPKNTTGNPHPSVGITGPAGLEFMQMAVNSAGTLFVSAIGAGYPQILVYPAGASGSAAPAQTWTTPELPFCLDALGKLYLTGSNTIHVYDSNQLSAGPLRTIRTPSTTGGGPASFSDPRAIAADPSGNIFVLNRSRLNADDAVLIFGASASGTTTPNSVITGPTTKLTQAYSIALDQQDNIYVGTQGPNGIAGIILVFAAGASGDAAPIRTISGPNTSLGPILDLHVAGDGTLYVNAESRANGKTHILTFSANADGDARPLTDLYPANPAEPSVSVNFGSFAIL